MSCGILPSYFINLYCILHPFGHLDAEESHAEGDDFGDGFGKGEAEDFQVFVGFAKDGEVVVELIECLREVVAVVADARGAVVGACLTNGHWELVELLNEFGFLR